MTTYCYISDTFEESTLRLLSTGGLLTSTFNLLYFLRGSSEVSLVVTIMLAIFVNIWSFLVILGTLLLGFTYVFMVLHRDHFSGFMSAYLFTFRVGVLGDTDLFDSLHDEVGSEYLEILLTVLFVFLELIVLVTMLNALISHMGDIYDRVREKSIGYQSLERLKLCLELLRFLPQCWVTKL
eukprot:UN22350